MPKQRKPGWLEKREGDPYFRFGVKIGGRRYFRSTEKTTERAAEGERDRLYQEIVAAVAAATEARALGTEAKPVRTWGEAIRLYWRNVGQHHDGGTEEVLSVGSANTFWSLEWLEAEIGADTLIAAIDGAVAQRVKAKRRGEPCKNSKRGAPARLVSKATVNRSVLQPMRKVLLHAAEFGHAKIQQIKWGDLLLDEPKERVRELEPDEEVRLFAALRPDYQPLVDLAVILGLRQAEAIVKLRWRHIGWGALTITVPGKGDRTDTMQLPAAARDILWDLRAETKPASDDELVFSYVAQRTVRPGEKSTLRTPREKGARYPITKSGLRREFRRALAAAGIVDFRYHDLRHTFASRMLRAPGADLKQVQKQCRHSLIETTMKYAHVRDADMRASMDWAAAASPRRADAKKDTGRDTGDRAEQKIS